MKTLDEVIKAFEICIGYYCSNSEHDVCPYIGESDMGCGKEPEKDALYYLKEYQRYQNTPSCDGHMRLVDYFEESQKNEPLTWSELKQMEGKPVWVETRCGKYATWGIVDHFDVSEYGIARMFLRGDGYLEKQEQGDVWQAYRKERS